MGIDISSKLMVGLDYEDVGVWLEDQWEILGLEEGDSSVGELLEELGLDHASPYYDSGSEDWFIGYSIPNYQSVGDTVRALEEAQENFEKITGMMPVVRGGADVY